MSRCSLFLFFFVSFGFACNGLIDNPNIGGDSSGEEDPLDNSDHALRCEESKVGPPIVRRLTASELRVTIGRAFPEATMLPAAAALGADPVAESGFANDAQQLVVGEQTARELLGTAEVLADHFTNDSNLPVLLPCAAVSPGPSCVGTFIDNVGPKLFRRNLKAEERSRYLALAESVTDDSDFETGLKWTLVALLQSPNLVYRSEVGTPRSGSRRVLEPWEIASALSYNYTGGPPDEELLILARGESLLDPETRLDQAKRLLATEAGHKKLLEFFRGWSGYQRVGGAVKNEVPNFDSIRGLMVRETEEFIESIVYRDGGGVREILVSDTTNLNAELSQYYGFGAGAGDFESIARPPEWGVGILAQGSMLAGYAHSDSSSPTQRGLLVYERFQCRDKLHAPANIPPIPAPQPGAKTTRQRYEDSHAASPGCNSCHQFFDPIGFAFENFDGTGRFRSEEGGLPIDASGTILDDDLVPVAEFNGLQQLATSLADMPVVTDCVSGLGATWSFGGAGGQNCLAEDARTGLTNGDFGLLDYFARLSIAPHFTEREE